MPKGNREDMDDGDLSDSDPLLRGDDTEGPDSQPPLKPLSNSTRFSIIGLTIALFLAFIIGVAYRKSEQSVYDDDVEVQSGHSNIASISYENYTDFPLTPGQYRAECRKAMEGMRHMGYWVDMKKDVPHHHVPGVCKSTVTYMLGSEVGLMGELALLAQVAALADSVSPRSSYNT
jgi:hypothetical protein